MGGARLVYDGPNRRLQEQQSAIGTQGRFRQRQLTARSNENEIPSPPSDRRWGMRPATPLVVVCALLASGVAGYVAMAGNAAPAATSSVSAAAAARKSRALPFR